MMGIHLLFHQTDLLKSKDFLSAKIFSVILSEGLRSCILQNFITTLEVEKLPKQSSFI